MKKGKYILFILFIIASILITSITIYASKHNIPEPPRGKDVPNDVVWDSIHGQYISKDVEVDPSNGQLRIKNNQAASIETAPINKIDPKEKWIQDNKESKNEIDKALIKYFEEHRKHPSPKAFYSVKDDEYLYILTNLGESKISEMLNRIEKGHVCSFELMVAVEQITKINGGIKNISNEGRSKWLTKFKRNSNGKY